MGGIFKSWAAQGLLFRRTARKAASTDCSVRPSVRFNIFSAYDILLLLSNSKRTNKREKRMREAERKKD